MTLTAPASARPSVALRRTAYVFTIGFNAVILYLLHVWPGWQAVPFLTEDTRRVLVLFNASLIATIAANLTYLIHDGPRWRGFGELVTAGMSLAVLIRIWRIFPFDFGQSTFDWTLAASLVLIVAIAGTTLGIIVQLVNVVRGGRT
jgi:hypothetical protein